MAIESEGTPAPESVDLKNPGLAAFLAWLVPGLGHWYQGRRAKAALYFISIMGLFVFGLYLSSSDEKSLGYSLIALNDQPLAEQVLELARKDNNAENFQKLAAQYSISPDSQAVHHDLSAIKKYSEQAKIEEEVSALKPGELSSVMHLGDTFVIARGEGTIGYGRAVYFSWRPGDLRLPYGFQIGVGLPAAPALLQASRMGNGRKVWCGGLMAPPWPSETARRAALSAADPNANQPTAHDLHRRLHRYFELAGFYTMVAGLLNVLAIYDAWAGPVIVHAATKKEEEEREQGD